MTRQAIAAKPAAGRIALTAEPAAHARAGEDPFAMLEAAKLLREAPREAIVPHDGAGRLTPVTYSPYLPRGSARS